MWLHCNRRNNEEVVQKAASQRAKGFLPVPLQRSAYILTKKKKIEII